MAFWHTDGFVAEQMPLRKKWLLSTKKKKKNYWKLELLKTKCFTYILTPDILPGKLQVFFVATQGKTTIFFFFTACFENNDQCHNWLLVSRTSRLHLCTETGIIMLMGCKCEEEKKKICGTKTSTVTKASSLDVPCQTDKLCLKGEEH